MDYRRKGNKDKSIDLSEIGVNNFALSQIMHWKSYSTNTTYAKNAILCMRFVQNILNMRRS